MINPIQHYAWGSTTALTQLYKIANPQQLPMAELWMGAHPLLSSQLVDEQGQPQSLYARIKENPSRYLGDTIAMRYGELPFLFKVLAAEQPLSIQVHPDKQTAEQGFIQEQQRNIPLTSEQRNYKDSNHKPELIYAITPFQAMNGFRPCHEIAQLLLPVRSAHPAIAHFIQQPNEQQLAQLFRQLLTLSAVEKQQALACLYQAMATETGEIWQVIQQIAQYYPDDASLFTPLLLNVITLAPGEAMFLAARTPHAYLHGVGLEIMANSDNVLRAGLTHKYIDVPELLGNVSFHSQPLASLRITPIVQANQVVFPVPVDDFGFAIYQATEQATVLPSKAAILFCLQGEVQLQNYQQRLTLQLGESVYIAANEPVVTIKGSGIAAYATTA